MSSGIPAFGTNNQWNTFSIALRDSLNGMGNYITQEPGSIAWIEAAIMAQLVSSGYNFLQLMSEQIQPASSSVYLDRWAQIYNIQSLSNITSIKERLQLIQSLTGTPPTYSNVKYLLQQLLSNCFLDIQWIPENQNLATIDPYQDLIVDGYQYEMPLSVLVVYLWQPRDNQDNLLITNTQFNQYLETYQSILNSWLPHFSEIITMNLINRGNQDGYAGGYNGNNYNNYLDGYNVVSGSAGSTTLNGTNTTFLSDFFPEAGSSVLPFSINRYPPIQIVDDSNIVQTYYVSNVDSNNVITLSTKLINNITNRTYRTVGIVFDTVGMFDGSSLFNH